MKKHGYKTNTEKAEAVKVWQKLRLSGLSGHNAAYKMQMSQATLYRWEQRLGTPLPDSPSPRIAARHYGGLHVQMRQVQRQVIPLRPHESAYVKENIEATCQSMPIELRGLWERALQNVKAPRNQK